MGDQPVTRANFDGLTATLNALAAQMAMFTTNLNNIANNNHNYNNRNNQNKGGGPIRVHGGDNQITEDSSSSTVEKTDDMSQLMSYSSWSNTDQVKQDNSIKNERESAEYNEETGDKSTITSSKAVGCDKF